MNFETKAKIEQVGIIIFIITLFMLPIVLMAMGS